MAKQTQQRAAVLRGHPDMLILRTLLYGPAHGHQIDKHIQRTTNEFLQMRPGSLYPAMHRLERKRMGHLQMADSSRPQSGIQVLPLDGERPEAACRRRIAVEPDGETCSACDVAGRRGGLR
jgi:hypothetical protein